MRAQHCGLALSCSGWWHHLPSTKSSVGLGTGTSRAAAPTKRGGYCANNCSNAVTHQNCMKRQVCWCVVTTCLKYPMHDQTTTASLAVGGWRLAVGGWRHRAQSSQPHPDSVESRRQQTVLARHIYRCAIFDNNRTTHHHDSPVGCTAGGRSAGLRALT